MSKTAADKAAVQKPATHTPGPWGYDETTLAICTMIVSIEDVRAFQVSPVSDESHAIAYVPCDVKRREAEANARLIAAAPDLLRLLKVCATEFEIGEGYEVLTAELDAVIAKAEGRS